MRKIGSMAASAAIAAILMAGLAVGIGEARAQGQTFATGKPAGSARAVVGNDIPPVLAGLSKMGARIAFIGEIGGLDGYLAAIGDQVQVVYLTPDRRHYVAGIAFSHDGSNVTAPDLDLAARQGILKQIGIDPGPVSAEPAPGAPAALRAAAPTVPGQAQAPTPTTAQATANPSSAGRPSASDGDITLAIENDTALPSEKRVLTWLSFGRVGAPVVYMAADLACAYCKRAWVQIAPAVDAGSIELRIIPVAVVSPASKGMALALFDSEDPRRTWMDNVVSPVRAVSVGSEGAKAAIDANNAFLASSLRGTPTFYYRKDGAPRSIAGLPADISVVIP